ncbi:MAG: hypothetical protein M1472_05280 [Planctomycetes bacterium]|nr:hypothetical protein [Planctomycetota bacterium]
MKSCLFLRMAADLHGRAGVTLRRVICFVVAILMAIPISIAYAAVRPPTAPEVGTGLVVQKNAVEPHSRWTGVAAGHRSMDRARMIKSGSEAIAVPEDPNWAKYVLLAVIWTLVIAAVLGPMRRFIRRQHVPPDILKSRGW